jgi:hypothetical protein
MNKYIKLLTLLLVIVFVVNGIYLNIQMGGLSSKSSNGFYEEEALSLYLDHNPNVHGFNISMVNDEYLLDVDSFDGENWRNILLKHPSLDTLIMMAEKRWYSPKNTFSNGQNH